MFVKPHEYYYYPERTILRGISDLDFLRSAKEVLLSTNHFERCAIIKHKETRFDNLVIYDLVCISREPNCARWRQHYVSVVRITGNETWGGMDRLYYRA